MSGALAPAPLNHSLTLSSRGAKRRKPALSEDRPAIEVERGSAFAFAPIGPVTLPNCLPRTCYAEWQTSSRPAASALYNSTPMQLRIAIVRYVDNHFPGFVECELVDAEGRLHSFIEKAPVVSDEWPGPNDSYPMSGEIRCEILEQWRAPDGRDLIRVTTAQPDYVESKDGNTKFVVLSSQVISAEATIAEAERKANDCERQAQSDPSRSAALLRKAASYREWVANLKRGHWRP